MPALNSEQSMFGDNDDDVAISPLMVCVATNGVGGDKRRVLDVDRDTLMGDVVGDYVPLVITLEL
jgi:hypothetical protein